jgi:hypothetical protein
MKPRSNAGRLAAMLSLFVLALGCRESYQARTARQEEERQEKKAAERKQLLPHYPSAVDFSEFEQGFESQFTVGLQDAIRSTPERTYWVEAWMMDVVRRGERVKLEFTGPGYGTSVFSLDCAKEVYTALTSDPKATQLDTYLVVFTLKAVTPAQLELRGEQNGEDVEITLDSTVGTRVFVGKALEVHRVP